VDGVLLVGGLSLILIGMKIWRAKDLRFGADDSAIVRQGKG
jgi:hypothetical protein